MEKPTRADNEDQWTKVPQPLAGRARPVQLKNISVTASVRPIKGPGPPGHGLVIEGQLECTIAHHEKHLTVGKHAWVTASIQARSVVVLGRLVGDIYSDGTVLLVEGCDVSGDIFCDRVVIQDGAKFEGTIGAGGRSEFAG